MELTDEQRDLRDAVRGLLAQRRGDAGDDRSLWRRLCGEIGVAGLAIPQRYGGAGAGPVETHIVMEELGRGLTCSPLLGSAVLAAQALLASRDAEACQRLLPAIADGSAVAALAWTTPAGHWDPGEAACAARPAARTSAAEAIQAIAEAAAARPTGTQLAGTQLAGTGAAPAVSSPDDWVLTGEAHHVLDGDRADVLLAAALTPGGTALFEVDPLGRGVTRAAVTTMDTTRRLAIVRLDRAPARPIGAGTGRASPGGASPASAALARARDLACIALSAEQVGAAQRALELTVAYTKVRVQFGQAIGSFQALQHRMAGLHVLVESARSLSRAAAAKVYCSEALARVAGEMIQLHGAIGITWEHDAHRYLKRAHGASQLFGRPSEHVARVAAAVIDG